jgi:hypothetical protein
MTAPVTAGGVGFKFDPTVWAFVIVVAVKPSVAASTKAA